MDTPWYRKLFRHDQKPDLKATRARADQGDADAQFGLGIKYANSAGAGLDYVQAAQWYRKAADQSHPLAQFNLGMMYAKGQGMPLDDVEAVIWIRKAAHQGDAGAQFNMGMRYYRASVDGQKKDVLESRLEAFKWLHLAAVQGYKDSDAACERVSLSMSREEVTEGNLRATRFVAGRPQGRQGE